MNYFTPGQSVRVVNNARHVTKDLIGTVVACSSGTFSLITVRFFDNSVSREITYKPEELRKVRK